MCFENVGNGSLGEKELNFVAALRLLGLLIAKQRLMTTQTMSHRRLPQQVHRRKRYIPPGKRGQRERQNVRFLASSPTRTARPLLYLLCLFSLGLICVGNVARAATIRFRSCIFCRRSS